VALGGAGLLLGTEGFSFVTAARDSDAGVATDGNEPLVIEVAEYVVAGGGSMDLVTLTNGTNDPLTVHASLDDPSQGTVSSPVTLAPAGTTTLSVSVPLAESDGSGTMPFTATATSAAGFEVTSPQTIPIYGLSRVVQDQSANTNTYYQVTYRVEGFPDFDYFDVEFDDRANSWADETLTQTARQGTFSYSNGGTMGDTYDITFTAYDTDGAVILQQMVTDVADGQDPPGNHDLSTPESPTLESFTVTDTTKWDNTHYAVAYEVSNTAEFQRVDVTFEDTEQYSSWATRTESSTSEPTGTVYYDQGGTEGDEYVITVEVVDTNGFVVDSASVTDVAGGDNTVSWP